MKSLKVPKKVAALIVFLGSTSEATSREIETGTGLRQPDVSIGMGALRQNNWVNESEIKQEGKGRPKKVYSLSLSLDEIIQHFEEEKSRESARAMEAIQRLREMAAT
jgi:predicted transcriptional regulator